MKRAILVAAFVVAMTAGSALGVFVSGWSTAESNIMPVVSASSGVAPVAESNIVPVVSASSSDSSDSPKVHGGAFCEFGAASGIY